jgi:hypothetical protein
MELTKEIQDLLQKNIPQLQANEFKLFIEEANANKNKLQEVRDSLSAREDQIAKLLAMKTEYESAKALKNEANSALSIAENKEREIEKTILTEKLNQRDFVIAKFENFLSLLVKNPRAVELISENRSVPVFEPFHGGGGHHTTQSELTTGTREQTETKE